MRSHRGTEYVHFYPHHNVIASEATKTGPETSAIISQVKQRSFN